MRPLRHIGGEVDFNEVFLDEVQVPDAWRIGAAGDGWRVAGSSLAGERQMVSGSGSGGVDRIGGAGADTMVARASGLGRAADPVAPAAPDGGCTPRSGSATGRTSGSGATVRAGGTPGPAASIGKVHQGTLNQAHPAAGRGPPRAWTRRPGCAGADYADRMPLEVKGMLRSRANTIEGGTTEVNKNILGERVLGLPREPDPWADRPWEEIPRS